MSYEMSVVNMFEDNIQNMTGIDYIILRIW